MAATLKLSVLGYGGEPREGLSRRFQKGPVTIGRGQENDWPLDDPAQHLSKCHCIIERQGDVFTIIDVSTNGVYLDGAVQPLGKGNKAPLEDGQRLVIGDYQMRVEIDNEPAEMPIARGLDNFASFPGETNDPLMGPTPGPPVTAQPVYGQQPYMPLPSTPMPAAPPPENPLMWQSAMFVEGNLDAVPGSLFAPIGGAAGTGSAPDHLPEVNSFFRVPEVRGRAEAAPLVDAGPAIAPPVLPPVHGQIIPPDWNPLSDQPSALTPGRRPSPSTPAAMPENAVEPMARSGMQPPIAENRPPMAEYRPSAAGSRFLVAEYRPPEQRAPVPEYRPAMAEQRAPVPEYRPPMAEQRPPVPEYRPAIAEYRPPSPEARPPGPEPRPMTGEFRPPVARPPTSEFRSSSGASSSDAELLLRAFLEGAGLSAERIPSAYAEAKMRAYGALMRELVDGLRELLATRTIMKGEFRIEQTMLRGSNNNPFKFSVDVEQALQALLIQKSPGYADPASAVREAVRDLKAHELGLVAGLQKAAEALLAALSPDALERRVDSHSVLSNVLPVARKARFWEVYARVYRQLAEELAEDVQGTFKRSFAKAYTDQVRQV
jgi:type VI secretion system FHA domain protein